MRVKHTFVRTVSAVGHKPGQAPAHKKEYYDEAVEVPEGSKFFHVRAPLMIHQRILKRPVRPCVVPEMAAQNGGCTILVSPHDDQYVAVRVAWCRFTDAYCRSLGRITAARKDPTLILRSELEKELESIEEQMLVSCCYPLRHDQDLLNECIGEWSRPASRYFQPGEKVAHAV